MGDYIIVDGLQGRVEYIGLKTTRVRSLGGELLIFANSDLTKSRIQNFKRMHQRRVAIPVAIANETALAELRKVPALLKDLVESTENTQFDRAYLVAYTAKSVNFELVYYVTKPDARTHLEAQQEILFKINDALRGEGIAMAFDSSVFQLVPQAAAASPEPVVPEAPSRK